MRQPPTLPFTPLANTETCTIEAVAGGCIYVQMIGVIKSVRVLLHTVGDSVLNHRNDIQRVHTGASVRYIPGLRGNQSRNTMYIQFRRRKYVRAPPPPNFIGSQTTYPPGVVRLCRDPVAAHLWQRKGIKDYPPQIWGLHPVYSPRRSPAPRLIPAHLWRRARELAHG